MKINTQKGFSLIELMVVVAIIGILATVAVPQVNKFMAKARQSEAKSTLAALYTAEKAFYTEYNSYFGGFRTIGFSPEGRVRYDAGFTGVGVAPSQVPSAATDVTVMISQYCGADPAFNNGCSLLPEGQGRVGDVQTGAASTAGNLSGVGTPTATQFQASAASALVSSSALVDTWAIDEKKNVIQVINGIP